jgi:hypothetical protein
MEGFRPPAENSTRAVASPIAIQREYDVRGRRRTDGQAERLSEREIANQRAGRIFTAGDTPATTAVSRHQRESAARIFASSALTRLLTGSGGKRVKGYFFLLLDTDLRFVSRAIIEHSPDPVAGADNVIGVGLQLEDPLHSCWIRSV